MSYSPSINSNLTVIASVRFTYPTVVGIGDRSTPVTRSPGAAVASEQLTPATSQLSLHLACMEVQSVRVPCRRRQSWAQLEGLRVRKEVCFMLFIMKQILYFTVCLYFSPQWKIQLIWHCPMTLMLAGLAAFFKASLFINKRAQRALGRSPEEKVKGQGEAIILL